LARIGERSAPMDTAVGEENESVTDQTTWPPELEGQSATRSLTDPASLSPEPEGQSTTQQTTSDPVMLMTSRPLILQHIQMKTLF